MGEDLALTLAAATGGRLTNIVGGVPITVGGPVTGALGVADGTPEQNEAVAAPPSPRSPASQRKQPPDRRGRFRTRTD